MEINIFLKLISAGILLLLLISAVNVAKKYYHNFILGIKLKEPTSISVCCGLAAGLLSKVADNSFKPIQKLNIGAYYAETVLVLEECLELGIPIFFLMAIIAYISGSKGVR